MTTTKPLRSWVPRSYQKIGVKKMISQACLGLFMKPGRGKTSVVLMALRILKDAGFVKRVLVICPIRPMYRVWPLQPHQYQEFDDLTVDVLHGKDKEDLLLNGKGDIAVVNPEGLEWLFGAQVVETDKGKKIALDPNRVAKVCGKFDMLVVDESTKFKAYNTNRFKLLRQIVSKFKRRYILTGSPMPKGLLDLFGQVFILDEGKSLGAYITHYRKSFFYPDGFGGYAWLPKDGARDKIIAAMGSLAYVVDEAPEDLPNLIINDVMVDLPLHVQAKYKQMEDDLMAGTVVAANAAVASSKCRQICNGAIYDESGAYSYLHELKYQAVKDLLEELSGSPLLITYEFGFDAAALHKMGIPNISSGDAKKDSKNIELFSEGKLPAVCGHPQSISLGIDGLQNNCKDICMIGINWSLENYEQVIDRVRRSGNPSATVTLHRILAVGTVDERVVKVLDGRDKEQVDFLRALRHDSEKLLKE